MQDAQTRVLESDAANSTWFLKPWKPPVAELQLFCLPYAGKGAAMYASWARELRQQVDVVPVQLPGRDARRHEPSSVRFGPLVEDIAEAMLPRLNRPYAVFGHSLGSLLAFEVCRALQRKNAPAPRHLFVSGRRAPHCSAFLPVDDAADDDTFVQAIHGRFGGIPTTLREQPDLLRFFLPTLRADFRLLNTYRFEDARSLSCALTAFCGRSDPCVAETELAAWGQHTSGAFDTQTFDGDHFYVHDAQSQLQRAILARLPGW